ncbi:hypothetical protein ID866_6086 [Astraeus odoratus]|nr:hypothetical protein ID866_6086 [Astraeus odoratus]
MTRSPFSYLPSELLIQIFVLCTQAAGPFASLTLASVCTRWREICMSSPPVWRLIVVNTASYPIASIRKQAELWIARSSPLSFDISLELADSEHLLTVMSYFLPHISRWRNCEVAFGGRVFRTCLSRFVRSMDSPVLQDLSLRLGTPVQKDTNDGSDGIPFLSFKTNTAGRVSLKVAISSLPAVSFLDPLRFTSLDIYESSAIHAIGSPGLLKFLARCPNLERFSFRGVCFEEGILKAAPIIVTLPRLHTLVLTSLCTQRSILSHLHLPALRELHLRELNMDFLLNGYHANESGDSDDEAHDFSRSPSSDHHTGMGLRRLISRSHPPLEVLNMDLSDMRTKDFAWVFDRLPHLKQFSVVGSDMSDNVIQLLKPLPTEGSGEDADGSRQRLYVRLPKLTALNLVACQQFSGDALIDALITRVRYTDTVTPNETLTRVVIAGCLRVMPNHERELSRYLRNRLHVS